MQKIRDKNNARILRKKMRNFRGKVMRKSRFNVCFVNGQTETLKRYCEIKFSSSKLIWKRNYKYDIIKLMVFTKFSHFREIFVFLHFAKLHFCEIFAFCIVAKIFLQNFASFSLHLFSRKKCEISRKSLRNATEHFRWKP